MGAIAGWRSWRRTIHDSLEVGGDAHPVGYVVNAFIMTLRVLNAIAFNILNMAIAGALLVRARARSAAAAV